GGPSYFSPGPPPTHQGPLSPPGPVTRPVRRFHQPNRLNRTAPHEPSRSEETINESSPRHHRPERGWSRAPIALDPAEHAARVGRGHALQPGAGRGHDPVGRPDRP